jgi:GDP-4-dehydro-6-deoxy-D-mannose reductase
MRILITGITGFVGAYLAEALLERGGVELFGIARHASWTAECQHLSGSVALRACDLTDMESIERILHEVQPQQVYHLAGYSHVGRSLHDPAAAWQTNLTATLRLYEAVCRWAGKPRLLHVSSAMVYGEPETPGQPLDERSPLRPATPYAASKAAADLAAYQYFRSAGLAIVRVRPFNHIGARQSPDFAVSSFARQVAQAAAGKAPPVIETGDLTPERDLTDVRDMVQAYRLLMELGRPGEVYNAGSGHAHSMQTVLDRLIALAGVNVEIRPRAVEMRRAEAAVLRADSTLLQRVTGWTPQYPLEETLQQILQYWRERL